MKFIYLNCGVGPLWKWYEDMIDHRSYVHSLAVVKFKPEKNSGVDEIRTHGLCDTRAVPY